MNAKIDNALPAKPLESRLPGSVLARAGDPRDTAIAAVPASDTLKLTGEAVGLTAMARQLATPAELDLSRINEIRASIESGTYKVNPQEIANRLLALEHQLLK